MSTSAVLSAALKRNALPFLAGAAVGTLAVLNQLGSVLAKYAPIKSLAPLWNINTILAGLSYNWVVAFLITITLATYVSFRPAPDIQAAYRQGVLIGLLALPVIMGGLALAGVVGWFISKVLAVVRLIFGFFFGWVGPVLSFLLTPIRWLVVHVISPLARILAWPIVWLWKNLLSSLVLPVWALLIRFVLRPAIILGVVTLAVVTTLLPLAALGRVFIRGVGAALGDRVSPQGAFDQGVGVGFLCFDALVMAMLNATHHLFATTSLFLVATAAAPVIYLVRASGTKKDWSRASWDQSGARSRANEYLRTSSLDVVVFFVMIPLTVALYTFSNSESRS
jgi:hypothetical protein